MRRITHTSESRETCLARALDYEWLAQSGPASSGAAWAWDQARLWRSLALIAKPAKPESR